MKASHGSLHIIIVGSIKLGEFGGGGYQVYDLFYCFRFIIIVRTQVNPKHLSPYTC